MFLFRNNKLDINRELKSSLKGAIWGLGYLKILKITSKIGLAYPFFFKNLNNFYLKLLTILLKGYVWSDVRIKQKIEYNIHILKKINSYKGECHARFLPVHGQRTHTNARTQRSKRIRNV